MRILSADDEQVSRILMERIMSSYGECVAVDGGKAALAAFKAAKEQGKPFDLVTLDISMPDMDGLDVLYEIRDIEKNKNAPVDKKCVIIMVTASADKDTIVTAVQAGCNDYIAKPIDRDTVLKKLIKVGLVAASPENSAKDQTAGKSLDSDLLQAKENLLAAVKNVFDEFKKGKIELPVFPATIIKIQDILKLPGAAPDEIVSAIQRDPVVTIKLVAAANLAPCAEHGKVKSAQQALTTIGLLETKNLVSELVKKSQYEADNKQVNAVMEMLYLHSSATACAARVLARRFSEDEETLFFLGLTHDIGKILLFHAVTMSLSAKSNAPAHKIDNILAIIQSVHAGFSGALYQRWGLEKSLVDTVNAHEGPDFSAGASKNAAILYLANILTRRIGYSQFKEEPSDMNEATQFLDLDETDIEVMLAEIKERITKNIGAPDLKDTASLELS